MTSLLSFHQESAIRLRTMLFFLLICQCIFNSAHCYAKPILCQQRQGCEKACVHSLHSCGSVPLLVFWKHPSKLLFKEATKEKKEKKACPNLHTSITTPHLATARQAWTAKLPTSRPTPPINPVELSGGKPKQVEGKTPHRDKCTSPTCGCEIRGDCLLSSFLRSAKQRMIPGFQFPQCRPLLVILHHPNREKRTCKHVKIISSFIVAAHHLHPCHPKRHIQQPSSCPECRNKKRKAARSHLKLLGSKITSCKTCHYRRQSFCNSQRATKERKKERAFKGNSVKQNYPTKFKATVSNSCRWRVMWMQAPCTCLCILCGWRGDRSLLLLFSRGRQVAQVRIQCGSLFLRGLCDHILLLVAAHSCHWASAIIEQISHIIKIRSTIISLKHIKVF